jgi:TolB-like protein/Tfp pilus assembly protein PilF
MRGVGVLLREARRRRVFRAAAVYIIAAWGLLQVLDLAFSSWEYPPEALQYVWIGAVLCFPLALVFGWRYDITSDGIVLTPPPDPGENIDLSLRSFDYILLASLAVVAAVVSTSTVHQVISVEPEPDEPAPIRSVAVLPFVNISEAKGMDYFSDGLTEELINLMADLEEIRVAARSSVYIFKGRDYVVAEVADRLAVDSILEGTVRRHQEDVRVTAQLVEASTAKILWTETYERRLEDIFAIQTDIARQVSDELEIVLSSRSQGRLERPWTKNPKAYDAYLMGREFLRRPKDAATLESSAERFQFALDLDSAFAQAHAGLCEARLGQYELTRESTYFQQAEAACLRALTRDSEATNTYVALAYLHYFAGQHEQAEKEFQHVIDLNQTLVDAYLGLARNYAADEQAKKAESAFQKAIDLDKAYWDSYQLFGNFLFGRGRYFEAAQNYKNVIKLTPGNIHAHNNLGAAYFMAGDFQGAAGAYLDSLKVAPSGVAFSNTGTMYYYLGDVSAAADMYRNGLEITPDDGRLWGNLGDALWAGAGTVDDAKAAYTMARDLTEQRLRINPEDFETMAELAYFSARLGDTDRALRMLSMSIEHGPDDMYTHYYAALIYDGMGLPDKAFASLEKAVALGYQSKLLKADPGFSSLSEDARFTALFGTESN